MADKELTVGSSGTWWIHTYQDYIKVIHVTFTVGLQKNATIKGSINEGEGEGDFRATFGVKKANLHGVV